MAERYVYIRYMGGKVCITDTLTERFFFCGVEELTPDEKEACDCGGDTIPMSDANAIMLSIYGK